MDDFLLDDFLVVDRLTTDFFACLVFLAGDLLTDFFLVTDLGM